MESKKPCDEQFWPVGWDENRAAQILRMARHSTAEQRLQWVEGMLKVFNENGMDYQEHKRRIRGR